MSKAQQLTNEQISELIAAAQQVRRQAYAPYSRMAVGAALLAEDGRVFSGCNLENAAFSPTICAERSALAQAISHGCRNFAAIAIVGGLLSSAVIDAAASATCDTNAPCGVSAKQDKARAANAPQAYSSYAEEAADAQQRSIAQAIAPQTQQDKARAANAPQAYSSYAEEAADAQQHSIAQAISPQREPQKEPLVMPCGVCRQTLREFCQPDFVIIAARTQDDYQLHRLDELLPHSFGPENLA